MCPHTVAGGAARMGCSRGAREPVVRYCVGAGPRAHPAAGARAVDGRRPPRGAAGARARTHGRVPARRARGGLHEAAGAPSRRQPGRPATDARHGSGTGTCDRRPSRCWRRWATRELPSHRSSRSASWRCWRGEVEHGLRNEEIASRLGISGAGVRYHLRNIYRKTGASKRADAVRYARSLRSALTPETTRGHPK